MKRKPIFPLSNDELSAMPTKRLLARLKQLHQCEISFELSDRDNDDRSLTEQIEFKDTPQWQAAYQQLKQILSSREHISSDAKPSSQAARNRNFIDH
jgi:hypothetical protein